MQASGSPYPADKKSGGNTQAAVMMIAEKASNMILFQNLRS